MSPHALRRALRALAARPGYAAAVLTIAVVVGAATTVFAVVNATLVRPLPVPDGDRLVWIYGQPPGTTSPGERNPIHSPEFVRFRGPLTQATGVAGIWFKSFAMMEDGGADNVPGATVSANYFDVLGVQLAAGRMFTEDEDRAGAHVAVVSDAFWRTRLGGRADAIGGGIVLDGQPATVIGILPPIAPNSFVNPGVYTPLGIHAGNMPMPTSTIVMAIARLAPGATASSLSDELTPLMEDVVRERAATHTGWGTGAMSLRDALFGDARPVLLLLVAAVGVLALIACANLTNVTVAGTAGRHTEITLRAALGASRADILTLFGIEQAIVAAIGGAAGITIAAAALPVILSLDAAATAGLGEVSLDWRVAAAAFGVTLVVSVLSGVIPVALATRGDLASALAHGGRRTAGSRRQRRVGAWLVGAETVLTAVLLTASALLASAFGRTTGTAPGFDPAHVLGTRVQPPATAYPSMADRAEFVHRMMTEIRALPGVVSAGVTDISFQLGGGYNTSLYLEGRPSPTGRPYTVQFRRVGPGYFETMRVPVVEGRTFTDADRLDSQPVTVVSRAFAERYWPGERAVGQRVIRAADPDHPFTVVGVVGDVRDTGLGLAPAPTFYIAHAQNNNAAAPVSVVIRTSGDPGAMTKDVAAAIHRVDPALPLLRTTTMDAFLEATLGPERFRSLLVGAFAVLGLVLAAVGIYGVTSRGVVERTRELGVRLALGSGRGALWRMVIGQALSAVGVGLLLSAPVAFVAVRGLSHWLENVSAGDALAAVPAVVLLAAIAAAAAAVPAWRASRLDPIDALRD
jgi:predicted permease